MGPKYKCQQIQIIKGGKCKPILTKQTQTNVQQLSAQINAQAVPEGSQVNFNRQKHNGNDQESIDSQRVNIDNSNAQEKTYTNNN